MSVAVAMKSVMALIVLLFVALPEIDAYSYGPSNKAVLRDEDVVMNCGSNESISRQWIFTRIFFEEVILSNELNVSKGHSNAKLNTSRPGQYDLHMSGVSGFLHAGTYSCILHNHPSGDGLQIKRYEAYLAVLFWEPKCSTYISGTNYTVTENDVLDAQCRVKYYSANNNNLRMKWIPEDLNIVNATTTVSGDALKTVTSYITIQITAQNNGLVLSCFTYFTEINESISEDPLLVKATNTPDYNHTCITLRVNVQAKRRDTTTESSKSNHYDQLTAVVSVVAALVIITIIAIFCYLRVRFNQMKNNIVEGHCDGQRSVVQQREIEMETTEDETTYEHINPEEELPQMGEGTTTYYNFQVQEPKYEGLCQESIQTSTEYDELSVQQREIEAQTTEDETTYEYVNHEEELSLMGDGTAKYYNFQIQQPMYLELCQDSIKSSTA